MAHTIVMPRFGATMEEGTINSWLVKEGDAVSKGDVLGEIAIEKLSNELLAEEDGIILKLVAEEGSTLTCGEPILIIGVVGETLASVSVAVPSPASSVSASSLEEKVRSEVKSGTAQAVAAEYHASAQISPKALQLAQEIDVDYHFIKGTGRFGMITREDIRSAVDAGMLPKTREVVNQAQLIGETHKMSQIQLSIANAMHSSLTTTAQTTISMDVDAAALVKAYRAHKEEYSRKNKKLTYTVLLIKIVAEALIKHKLLRTVIEDTNMVMRGEINIGVAIDVFDALLVPNIKNAHQKSLSQIASELESLGERAKNNLLKPDEMNGGTFTITNLGMFGIKYFTPILKPGESGILGVGTIQEVVQVQDGGIFVKPILNLSLTHDHCVVNGATGARFLQTVQQMANECEALFTAGE